MRRSLPFGAAIAVIALFAVPIVASADPGDGPVVRRAALSPEPRLAHAAYWAKVREYADAVTTAQFIEAKFVEAMQLKAAQQRRARSCSSDPASFLDHTKTRESHGDYGAVSGSGTYRGAYQFDQNTWDSNAAASGRTDLVGADPAAASAVDQDRVAADTYSRRGSQPWGGGC